MYSADVIHSNPSPVTVAFTNSPAPSASKDSNKIVYDYSLNGAKSFPVITARYVCTPRLYFAFIIYLLMYLFFLHFYFIIVMYFFSNQNMMMKLMPTSYDGINLFNSNSSSLFNNSNNYMDSQSTMPNYEDPSIHWQNNGYPVQIDSIDKKIHF